MVRCSASSRRRSRSGPLDPPGARWGHEQRRWWRRTGEDLSALNTQLRGDLDWIVMKCLEKDRTRRYETANGPRRTFPAPTTNPSRPDHPARFTGCKGHSAEQTRLHRGDGNPAGAGAGLSFAAAGFVRRFWSGTGPKPRADRRGATKSRSPAGGGAAGARQEKTLRPAGSQQ